MNANLGMKDGEPLGLEFFDVDLRWGVTDEAAAAGQVLPLGLRKLKRRQGGPSGQHGGRAASSSVLAQSVAIQVSNLLNRRLPVGRPFPCSSAGGLEIRDTADCQSALRSTESSALDAALTRRAGWRFYIEFGVPLF